MVRLWPKLFVSLAALAALVFAVLRNVEVQVGIVALVVLAALPWLTAVVESIDLPGGGGVRLREISEKVQKQDEQLSAQRDKQQSHDKQLHVQQQILNTLVIYSLSWYLFEMLETFYHLEQAKSGEYLFRDDDRMKHSLRFLRDHGYLEHFTISDLRDGENLMAKIKLTPVGNYMVELRKPPRAPEAAEAAQQMASAAVPAPAEATPNERP